MTAAYFTDSCCDLPHSYAEERDLTIVPMSYRVDGVDYVDDYGLSLSYHDFYEKLRAGIPSSTSQVTSAQYEAALRLPWRPDGTSFASPSPPRCPAPMRARCWPSATWRSAIPAAASM